MEEFTNTVVSVVQWILRVPAALAILGGIVVWLPAFASPGKRPSAIHDIEGYKSGGKSDTPDGKTLGYGCLAIIVAIVLLAAADALNYLRPKPKSFWDGVRETIFGLS